MKRTRWHLLFLFLFLAGIFHFVVLGGWFPGTLGGTLGGILPLDLSFFHAENVPTSQFLWGLYMLLLWAMILIKASQADNNQIPRVFAFYAGTVLCGYLLQLLLSPLFSELDRAQMIPWLCLSTAVMVVGLLQGLSWYRLQKAPKKSAAEPSACHKQEKPPEPSVCPMPENQPTEEPPVPIPVEPARPHKEYLSFSQAENARKVTMEDYLARKYPGARKKAPERRLPDPESEYGHENMENKQMMFREIETALKKAGLDPVVEMWDLRGRCSRFASGDPIIVGQYWISRFEKIDRGDHYLLWSLPFNSETIFLIFEHIAAEAASRQLQQGYEEEGFADLTPMQRQAVLEERYCRAAGRIYAYRHRKPHQRFPGW